jgi:hypothetical protein
MMWTISCRLHAIKAEDAVMSAEKKMEPTKQEPKTKSADALVGKNGDIELTEKELGRVAGGIDWGDGTLKEPTIGKV